MGVKTSFPSTSRPQNFTEQKDNNVSNDGTKNIGSSPLAIFGRGFHHNDGHGESPVCSVVAKVKKSGQKLGTTTATTTTTTADAPGADAPWSARSR